MTPTACRGARPRITLPAVGRSCLDDTPGPPPEIDVAQLSLTLPDGVYYAGRRLRSPPLTFDERLNLVRFVPPHDSPSEKEAFKVLYERAQHESIVLRWEVADHLVMNGPAELRSRWSVSQEARFDIAFIWGKATRHNDTFKLGHALLEDTVSSRTPINPYVDGVMIWMDGFGADWLLPQLALRRLIASADLLAARRVFDATTAQAMDVGVDVDRLLRDGRFDALEILREAMAPGSTS